MILAKMHQLNPTRMGLMFVDQVPLVFQQADAIKNDTNLSVVTICGENKTNNVLNKINRECYDILVITGGAFYKILQDQDVDVSLFSSIIFDVCRHSKGNHLHVEIMKMFMCQKVPYQPRVVGLTALQFAANNLDQA